MTIKSHFFMIFIFLLVFNPKSFSQDQAKNALPEVTLFHGKIVDILPYSRKFFITGDIPPFGEWELKKVSLVIYKSNNVGAILSDTIISDEWIKSSNNYQIKLFVSKGLNFNKKYLLNITYHLSLEIKDEDEINKFMKVTSSRLMNYAESKLVGDKVDLVGSDLEELIKQEYKTFISQKFESNKSLVSFSIDNTNNNIDESFSVAFPDEKLSKLKNNYSRYYQQINYLDTLNKKLKENTYDRIKIENGLKQDKIKPEIKKELEDELLNKELQIRQVENRIASSQEELKKVDESIKTFFENDFKPFISSTITYGSEIVPSIASIEDLETVRVGTSFGGGAAWLNNLNDNYTVGFGYIGLKFHLQPVDKRLVDPYIGKNKNLNRLSFLIGFGLKSNNTQYHGQELKPLVLNTYPMLGFSYDINRYFSMEAGAMLFMYDAISPLKSSSTLKASPFVTLGFDIDLFNRFSALFKGQTYSLLGISTKTD